MTRAQKKALEKTTQFCQKPEPVTEWLYTIDSANPLCRDMMKPQEVPDSPEFDQCKRDELKKYEDHGAYEWVKDERQPTVRSRWVLTKNPVVTRADLIRALETKQVPRVSVVKLKARLTPQGTLKQDPDREGDEQRERANLELSRLATAR